MTSAATQLSPLPQPPAAPALQRGILNAATNAAKVAAAGFVEIAARPLRPHRLEFSIRDTGPGIDAQTLQVLYQPFRKRAPALRYEFSSSGLGLAICRKL